MILSELFLNPYFSLGVIEHVDLFQRQVFHAQNCRRTQETLIYSHYEALQKRRNSYSG